MFRKKDKSEPAPTTAAEGDDVPDRVLLRPGEEPPADDAPADDAASSDEAVASGERPAAWDEAAADADAADDPEAVDPPGDDEPGQADPAAQAATGSEEDGAVTDAVATEPGIDQAASGAAYADAGSGEYDEEEPGEERFDRRTTWYVLRKSVREFNDDRGTDLAAALTYYSVLSIFPAALALLSLIGLFGNGEKSVDNVLDVLEPLVSSSTLENVRGPLTNLAHSQAAGATLIIGLIGALWSASAYIGAFGRAMNRVYEVEEGRAIWRLRPVNIAITIITVVLSAVAVVILGASGPVAKSLGDKLGLGDQAVTVWEYAKWPVLVIIVVLIIDILYYATPNVRFPKFRALSAGAFVALIVWAVASVGLGFYVANFSSYDRTYGSVAGVVVALLWLWITNVALVYGAEVDSERERARELHRGIPAEERLQLPMRTSRAAEKAERRRRRDQEKGREIREQRVGAGDPADRPF